MEWQITCQNLQYQQFYGLNVDYPENNSHIGITLLSINSWILMFIPMMRINGWNI